MTNEAGVFATVPEFEGERSTIPVAKLLPFIECRYAQTTFTPQESLFPEFNDGVRVACLSCVAHRINIAQIAMNIVMEDGIPVVVASDPVFSDKFCRCPDFKFREKNIPRDEGTQFIRDHALEISERQVKPFIIHDDGSYLM